ncbi:hypothetical protein [Paraflavitalea pollutisoli]|uniref:hypothetical protein n=1 Tax=Paraflavitalea pollutisoli TaxID=3034143 RepID=UPI0023EC1177|nr:hypothetical protein [Paraflavitalea sp. H1-2-19X]
MARFNCIPPVTGNLGPVVIYEMYGRYFMRTTSSLTRERVKKDPAFGRTRELASLLAKASRMAAAVYAVLPADKKMSGLYRKLTGEAMYWLCNQWTVAEVKEYLQRMYLRPLGIQLVPAKAPVVKKPQQRVVADKPLPEEKQLPVTRANKRIAASQHRSTVKRHPLRVIPATTPARRSSALVHLWVREHPARRVAGIESS